MTKLAPHYQYVPQWAPALVAEAKLGWVKQIFHGGDYEDLFPSANTIARHDVGGDGVEAEYIARGHQGGLQYFARLSPAYEALRGKVLAHEGPNEPGVGDPEARRRLSEFYCGWLTQMRASGFKTVSGCFSTGTPDVTYLPAASPERIEEVKKALRELGWALRGSYLGLHQYGWPTMLASGAAWMALRHRLLRKCLNDCGILTGPYVLGECGLDGTQVGCGGWKTVCGWDEYRAELHDFDLELDHDSYVRVAFPFTSGPDAKWQSFDIGEGESRSLWL